MSFRLSSFAASCFFRVLVCTEIWIIFWSPLVHKHGGCLRAQLQYLACFASLLNGFSDWQASWSCICSFSWSWRSPCWRLQAPKELNIDRQIIQTKYFRWRLKRVLKRYDPFFRRAIGAKWSSVDADSINPVASIWAAKESFRMLKLMYVFLWSISTVLLMTP
jgi:hypothetical protein